MTKGDKSKEFEFTVTLSGKTADGKDFSEITQKYGDLTFENGKAAFKLKDGESVTAKGIPAGVKYEVKETPADGYTSSSEASTGTIQADQTANAAFTNATETKDSKPDTKPNQPNKPTDKNPVSTGDSSDIALMMGIFAAAAAGISAIAVYRRKTNR